MTKRLAAGVVLCVLGLATAAAAQDAKATIAAVSKAIGADGVTSVTYSGTAADVNFLQTRNINGPWPLRPITNYTRTLDLGQVALRSSGATSNQGLFGGAPVAGNFNQNIAPTSTTYAQQVEYWITPWGFLKGAAANNATTKKQKGVTVISWQAPFKSPSGLAYTLNGYVNAKNQIERVETWLDHDMLGDMHIDVAYSDYKDFGGVQVPTTIVQQRGGFTFFETHVTDAKANPTNVADLLRPPAPPAGRAGGGAPPGAGGPPAQPTGSTKLAEGVYKINGAYNALAVEFKDFIAVVEGPQSVARGQEVVDEVHKVFPTKPIRYVVNSHPHSDHAGGLAPFVADGATIVTAQNNVKFMQTTFSAPRTLVGDKLAQNKRKPKVEGIAAKKIITDGTRTLELHHIIDSDVEKVHSDGIVVALLPKERILFQADFTLPTGTAAVNPFTRSLGEYVVRENLDFDQYISVHNSPLQQTKADLMRAIGRGTN